MIKRIVAGSAIGVAGLAAFFSARRWFLTWGADAVEAKRTLQGDELVPDPTTNDTRGITIDAPVDAVWPWLVQLGYGRGGWYSYDAMDMKGASADTIRPELQGLAVGDVVPTDPNGGFIVRTIEPERALVLYVDQEIMASRGPAPSLLGEAPGVAVSGKILETAAPPNFTAVWAFALEPLADGRTRLIERFRARMEGSSPGSRFFGPVLGFGVFVMTQRQMLGIKARAEKLARGREGLHRDVDKIVEEAMTAGDGAAPEAAPA